MARKLRASSGGVPEHVIQRGNNRHIVFGGDNEMKAYVTWLNDYARKYKVAIHAWVLMTNHVHLLCTPSTSSGISLMMQSLGRMYVLYFNRRNQRSGTLWEGRYRSCLVQEENYLMQLYRYIELNPVRAGLADDPADYSWSSYQCNALGKKSDLLSPHPLFSALGADDDTRQAAYRALFKDHVEGKLLADIRNATNKGLALGNARFITDVEARTGRRLTPGKRGRPTGWRKAMTNELTLPA
jgi:putative transposase